MNSLKKNVRWIFAEYQLEDIWLNADESDFEIRDNDLYFYDPQNETGISLGRQGDGWVCIFENFEDIKEDIKKVNEYWEKIRREEIERLESGLGDPYYY